mmetsp:Transcript_33288/g.43900  ORF Transcript_33288/g.43900 Transcript_33288/m.43900 type:complete len:249 (+) Transcript_33288:34-780(+)
MVNSESNNVLNADESQHCCFRLRKDDSQNGCLFSVCNLMGCLWLYVALFEMFLGMPQHNFNPDNEELPKSLEAKSKYKRKKRRRRKKKAGGDGGDDTTETQDLDTLRKPQPPTMEDILKNFYSVLSIGLPLIFHEPNGRARLVTVVISDEVDVAISWRIEKGLQRQVSCLKIRDIKYVEVGLSSDFSQHNFVDSSKGDVSFVLVTHSQSFLFECTNKAERNAFVNGFSVLINHCQNRQIPSANEKNAK